VDQKEYRSMISSLLYLTATRPDIQFYVCLRACFQAYRGLHIGRPSSISSGIFDTLLSLVSGVLFSFASWFSDADFAGCRVDRKSTSGTCQFLGSSLVSWSSRK
jgi:hypothetical protein